MRDNLVAFLIRHCIAGMVAGWTTVALLLWTDLAGLGTLMAASDLWPMPHLMLFAFFGLTFGSASMGAAIMGLGREAEPLRGREPSGRRGLSIGFGRRSPRRRPWPRA